MEPLKLTNSPFSDRNKIDDSSRFFDRLSEKKIIFDCLMAPKPQSVAIIGAERIGRSSLLQNIKDTYSEILPNPQRYCFSNLVDLSLDIFTTPEVFYAEVAHSLLKRHFDSLNPREFEELLSGHTNQRYVLLLDNFDQLKKKEWFDEDFCNGIRARANAGKITYVLTSNLPLAQIVMDNMSFCGIFEHISLDNFNSTEAHTSFLRHTSPQLSQADFEEVSRWLNYRYHPLKLNIAANLIQKNLPNRNYKQLRVEYNSTIKIALGIAVRDYKRKNERKKRLENIWKSFKEFLSWCTEGNRGILLIILILLLLEYISIDDLIKNLLNILTP